MSRKTKAARAEEVDDSFLAINAKLAKMRQALMSFKAREGRVTVALLALKIAYQKQDHIAINRFITDLLKDYDLLGQCAKVMTNRDLAMKMALGTLAGAEQAIRNKTADDTGADFIAQTIASVRGLDPFFLSTYEDTKVEATA